MAVNVDLIGRAKVMKEAGLYDDMVQCMKEWVETTPVLSDEERDLLSEAYGDAVGSRRSAWRIASSAEQKAPDGSDDHQAATWLRERVETEMKVLCGDVLTLLGKLLKGDNIDDEAQVFYYKMKGDHKRYLAEITEGEDSAKEAAEGKTAYEQAWSAAMPLKATNPLKLKLALNFSLLHYEILKRTDSACTLAKEAFDTAVTELDGIPDPVERKYSTDIMHQLRDNLTLWQSENEGQEEN
ncbi:14-3-3-like protein [Branchiostoma floridae x Branchiostoma japonicum]